MENGKMLLMHKSGTEIFCENGHKVAEVVEDLFKGDYPYAHKISKYEPTQTVPIVGDPLPIRCFCGAIWCDHHILVNANRTDLWIQL